MTSPLSTPAQLEGTLALSEARTLAIDTVEAVAKAAWHADRFLLAHGPHAADLPTIATLWVAVETLTAERDALTEQVDQLLRAASYTHVHNPEDPSLSSNPTDWLTLLHQHHAELLVMRQLVPGLSAASLALQTPEEIDQLTRDAEVARILALSDEEILAETIAAGLDPAQVVAEGQAIIDSVLAEHAPPSDTALEEFYVHRQGNHSYVKPTDFFRAQGGETADWGRRWRLVRARDQEHARLLAMDGPDLLKTSR